MDKFCSGVAALLLKLNKLCHGDPVHTLLDEGVNSGDGGFDGFGVSGDGFGFADVKVLDGA